MALRVRSHTLVTAAAQPSVLKGVGGRRRDAQKLENLGMASASRKLVIKGADIRQCEAHLSTLVFARCKS
jgi:hypothetical protein